MIKLILNNKGFSLIEVIAVLLMVSILAAGTSMGIITVTQGYLHASRNAQMAQKTNIAMKRISREFQQIISVSNIAANSITFVSILGTRTIGFDNNAIKLSVDAVPIASGDAIMDNITSLSLSFINSTTGNPWLISESINDLTGITILFQVLRSDISSGNMTFTTTVYLRNNENSGGAI